MKKNIVPIILSVSGLVLASGILSCATTKIQLSTMSPAAIVSVTGTELVPWQEIQSDTQDEEDGNDSVINGTVNKLLDSKNPEIATAADRLDYAEDSFRHIVPELSGLQILDREKVTGSESYRTLRPSFYNALSASAKATGYKDLTVMSPKAARIFMDSIEARSLVMLDFAFRKDISSGTRSDGFVYALVHMKAKVLDERGREKINKVYTAESSKKVRILYDDYNKEEMLVCINEAIDIAITKFAADFEKNLSPVSIEQTEEDDDGNTPASYERVAPTKLGKPKKQEMTKEENIASEKSPEEIARTLLDMGLDSAKVSEATGLSVEKIQEIQKADAENADATEKE